MRSTLGNYCDMLIRPPSSLKGVKWVYMVSDNRIFDETEDIDWPQVSFWSIFTKNSVVSTITWIISFILDLPCKLAYGETETIDIIC